MDHGSLYDLLHNASVMLKGENLLPMLRDVSQGMRFLHSADPVVIHGDLKAANILVDNKFRAKVADFGLSQKRSMGVTGTPYWMAPELLVSLRHVLCLLFRDLHPFLTSCFLHHHSVAESTRQHLMFTHLELSCTKCILVKNLMQVKCLARF
jgi:serine/threonine protein kinase